MTDSVLISVEEEEYLPPCPICQGVVEWTNSRDQDILTSRIQCTNCLLSVFHVDTTAFTPLPNLDYETTVMKYKAWCKTNPITNMMQGEEYGGDY